MLIYVRPQSETALVMNMTVLQNLHTAFSLPVQTPFMNVR